MPDISKCAGENCPRKESCYRFTAPASEYQCWFKPDPEACEYYWPVREKERHD